MALVVDYTPFPKSHVLTKTEGQIIQVAWGARNTSASAPKFALLSLKNLTTGISYPTGTFTVAPGASVNMQNGLYLEFSPAPEAFSVRMVNGVNSMALEVHDVGVSPARVVGSHPFVINFGDAPPVRGLEPVGNPTVPTAIAAGQILTCIWPGRNAGTTLAVAGMNLVNLTTGGGVTSGVTNVGPGVTVALQHAIQVSDMSVPPSAFNMPMQSGVNEMMLEMFQDTGPTNEVVGSFLFSINFTGGTPPGGFGPVGAPTITSVNMPGQILTCTWSGRNTRTTNVVAGLALINTTTGGGITGNVVNVGPNFTTPLQFAVQISGLNIPPSFNNMPMVNGVNEMTLEMFEDTGPTNNVVGTHNFVINFQGPPSGPNINAVGEPTIQ